MFSYFYPEVVMLSNTSPDVRFYRVIESARLPQRADRSAVGTLPVRAVRYCDAITSATGFGWWAFAPMDLSLMWDGADIFWTYAGVERWLPLAAAQFPHLGPRFDAVAPECLRGCAPPMLTAIPEPGVLQIWTGLFARTAPGWSLLVRAPANLPLPGGYVAYEGIVETDRWFGPLFTNIRLTRTHSPIQLRADFPLLQIQPVPRRLYTDAVLDDMRTAPSLNDLNAADWEDYHASIAEPSSRPERPFGGYATEGRRLRKSGCPVGRGAQSDLVSR